MQPATTAQQKNSRGCLLGQPAGERRDRPAPTRLLGRHQIIAQAAVRPDVERRHESARRLRAVFRRRTLGIAVFSGMLGVTIFGLFLTPVFYVVIRRITARRKRDKSPVERPAPELAPVG